MDPFKLHLGSLWCVSVEVQKRRAEGRCAATECVSLQSDLDLVLKIDVSCPGEGLSEAWCLLVLSFRLFRVVFQQGLL